MSASNIVLFLLSGVAMGTVSSLFGIGGGALLVPILTLAFGMPIHQAVAISLVTIVPTALVGAYRHWLAGNVQWVISGLLAVGGIVGANIGAALGLSMSGQALKRLFAVFLIAVALRLFFSK